MASSIGNVYPIGFLEKKETRRGTKREGNSGDRCIEMFNGEKSGRLLRVKGGILTFILALLQH